MLSDRHTKLVIDYVDGTLSPRRRKTVLKLLHKSPKAQRLLEQLQANVQLLRSLPKRQIDPQFVTTLLEEIKSRGLERVSGPVPVVEAAPLPLAAPRPVDARRAFPTWLGVAVAAAVLAMVSFGSYLFFANLGGEQADNNTPVVQTPQPKIVPEQMLPDPLTSGLIAGANYGYNRPIGLQVAGRDLTGPQTQKLLAKELQRGTSFHLEVAARTNGPAVAQLIDLLQMNKVKVYIDDERTKPALASNRPRVEYLVYAENMSAADLTKVLHQLGADAKADHVQSVQLSPLTNGHRATLSRILGVDVKKLQAPPPSSIDLHNPIEVPKDKENKQGKKAADSQPKNTEPPSAEPLALVMVLEPGMSRSAQIQQFLASRKTVRPGSLQLVMVVHS